ncbi:MAG: polysaccharide biosynthesis protein [Clostridia bacterium]|nr:polysaccharide biosynthesis protein [Clostridia bacterium]
MFTNKTLLITGGTGSFGNAVAERFLPTEIGEIRIFSRDEKKQNDMRRLFREKMPEYFKKLKFYIGDVRDRQALDQAMNGVDMVFHAAALKQVPSCEFFPLEAVKTNVLGTENVLDSAIACGVSKVICLSTDKAAYPVSAMGMSKAMMEKIVIAKARLSKDVKTVMCCTRYGNVIGSRGSVIPLWIEQIQSNSPITVTDPDMTRFIMSLDEAVDLVVYAFQNAENGDIMVQKAPACTLNTLAEAVCALYGGEKSDIKYIGIRHGEKRYETLLTAEEAARAVDIGNHFRVPCDNRDLNYQAQSAKLTNASAEEFNSNNTFILNTDEVISKLKEIL